ncbi:MAG: hypothetical protein GY807_23905 [Gammaproteobacteria bacterium]|nr:hypothetical protein [Gammaproteobacteria bacterium]
MNSINVLMNKFSFSGVFRFLIGILLAQIVTIILVVAAFKTQLEETWIIFTLLVLTTGLLAALLSASIAKHVNIDAIARVKEGFSKEREKIRVCAEKEKTKVIKQSHQQIIKVTSRARSKADFKVGAAFLGLLGMGAMMLFTQLFAIGLLTISTAGGGLAGYLMRARQESLGHKDKTSRQRLSRKQSANMPAIKSKAPIVKQLQKKSN